MADEKTAAGFAEASRNLQKVTGELREFNINAGKEIADQMGKEITKVTDPFVNAFQTIPGVQTLGTVGKTIFNKTFAALKDKREKELQALCDLYRSNNGGYDVIVPGSGGKDSAYTAHILKYKYGMNPLTCTWPPILYTDYGYKNFKNWIS